MDTWEIIEARKKVLDGFYKQVDKTRSRLNLEKFQLTHFDRKTKLDNVINVTENRSVTYVTRIIAGLMSSKWQCVVEGEIGKKEAYKIEQILEANLNQADEYLLNEYGLAGLDAWIANHVCHTSLIGIHWLSYMEDGEYKIHCLPIDMRWCPFVLNKWAAPITFRSKEDLLQELEEYKDIEGFKMPAEWKDTDNEVRDFWRASTPSEKGVNELWIEKELVFTQENTYGNLPFVFVWPPSGFMFRDKGYLEHESPGLLYLNENLYDQLSRQLSIDATLGFEPISPAYEYETENPSSNVSRPVPRLGESQEVPKGELHKPVPRSDVNRAQLASRDEVSRMVDEAAPMAPRAYATPPAAIEVVTEVELLDELQNPRVIALQMFKGQLARLIIDQAMLIIDKEVSAGQRGRKQNFTITDLKDPDKYIVSYQLMKQNKRLAIVNESRALALWGKAPMEYILRDILSVEDPDGWMREMELEKAKAANPAISLAEMAIRYAEEAEDLEGAEKDLKNWQSQILVHDYVMLIRQRMQPAMPAETEKLREATKETSNAQGLISLVGQRGANLPAQKGVTV